MWLSVLKSCGLGLQNDAHFAGNQFLENHQNRTLWIISTKEWAN